MASLRFPVGVPAGPLQELFLVMHELHGLAGEPSVRDMAEAAGCSHHKVHQMFTQPRLPADGDTLWAIVGWLARQGRRPRIRTDADEEEFYNWFEEKWRSAKRWVVLNPSALDIGIPSERVSASPDQRTEDPPPVPIRRAAAADPQLDQETKPRSQDDRVIDGRVITADFSRSQDRRTPRSALFPDPKASRAVFIGAGDFDDADLPPLPSVSAGAQALGALLTSPHREGSFLPASTQTVINPTRIELLDAIEKAASAAVDTLFIYFSGHGLLTPHGELTLAGRDTRYSADYTSASWEHVRRLLSATPALRTVVFLDCCFSGKAVDEAMGPLSGMATPPAGTYLIASTGTDRASIAPTGARFTAFTGALIELLNEGIPGGPEYLTLDEIYRQLRETLMARAAPEPHQRATGAGTFLALGYNPAYRQDSEVAEPEAMDHRAGAPAQLRRYPESADRECGDEGG